MDLFLTSSPCDNNVPKGVELPCIFFERNGFTRALLQLCRPGLRLTVIAAAPEAYALNDEMLETFKGCFEYCGLKPSSSVVIDARNVRIVPLALKNSDVIILGGGHVPTQNAFFEKIRLRELLKGYDGLLMGISAGSMNCARNVYAIPEESGEAIDPDYKRFFPGLGLTEIQIIPHMNKLQGMHVDGMAMIDEIALGDSINECFYAIEDGSYIFIREDGKAVVRGKAWRIHEGYIDQICDNGLELDLHTKMLNKL